MNIDNDTYLKLKKRIAEKIPYYVKNPSKEYIEDITHDVIIHRCKDESKRANQHLNHSIIDVLRQKSGRKKVTCRKTKKQIDAKEFNKRKRLNRSSNRIEDFHGHVAQKQKSLEEYSLYSIPFDEACKALSGDLRSMFILHYKWGLQLKDIAEIFGCTSANISHHFKLIHQLLKDHYDTEA